MSAPYGPEQPDQPWQPPAQSGPPGSGWPPAAPGPSGPYGPPTPPSAPPAQYGPPHPVDPYAPQPAGPGPYGPPTPYSAPPAQYSAPPAQYGPPPPIDPYSAPPAGPGPYGPPMPYSAPPGPPTMVWPGMAPPPARNRGRNVAIVLGITLPILVIIIAVVGFLVVPKLLDNQQAGPDSSTTPTPSADPLAVPQVGSCYLASVSASPIHLAAEDGQQVACEESHSLETIAAGAVEDPTWPDEFTDQARGLYAACEQAAQEFLGVSWRSTYAWLVLSIPSESAWDDGAQWYRCDLTVNEGFYQTTPGRTTGSLRDAAQPITCLTWTVADSSLTDIAHSECSAVHQGELAGVFAVPADADYTDLDALTEDFDNQCEPIVLEFLGTGSIHEELSYWFSWPDAEDLDQWVLCLVSANEDNRAFSASLNGVGSGPIPFA